MKYFIKLQKVPSQEIEFVINDNTFVISLYMRGYDNPRYYIDIIMNDLKIISGRIVYSVSHVNFGNNEKFILYSKNEEFSYEDFDESVFMIYDDGV